MDITYIMQQSVKFVSHSDHIHISSPESGICKNIFVNLTRFLDKDNNNNSKICLDFWIPGDINAHGDCILT
jgi:hypothetical protein